MLAYPETQSGDRPATAFGVLADDGVAETYWNIKDLSSQMNMEMGGILKYAPMEEAAILALYAAGIHMLEICHSPELILRCYESLIHEAERSAGLENCCWSGLSVAAKLRKVRFGGRPSRALSAGQLAGLP